MFTYKQEMEVSSTADTDHIRVVIDMFLLNLKKNSEEKLFETLNYIEKTMIGLEEAMGENKEDCDYFEGKYQALYELQSMLLNFDNATKKGEKHDLL
jgi:hypothetical protein